jgi:GAF domain-containing protein
MPLKATIITVSGWVIAIASYHPNAFDRSDLELLPSMAGSAALALDNTFLNTLIEEQAYVDNHRLKELLHKTTAQRDPLKLADK